MEKNNLKYFLILIFLLAISSLISGFSLKAFIGSIFGVFLWTNTLIPKYFKRLDAAVNLLLLLSLYIFINLTNSIGNLSSIYNLENSFAPTTFLIPPIIGFLDIYFFRIRRFFSFFFIPIIFFISFQSNLFGISLGLLLSITIVYFKPLINIILKSTIFLKMQKLSTFLKMINNIKTVPKKHNISKNIVLIGLGIIFFIYVIGFSGILRITGGRELVWLGHIYQTSLFSRELNDIVSPELLANKFGLVSTISFYKRFSLSNSIFITNPHSMLIGTLTKFGFLSGLLCLYMVFNKIVKMMKNIKITTNQYIAFIMITILSFLNGKGFLSFNEYNILLYISFLSILNIHKSQSKI